MCYARTEQIKIDAENQWVRVFLAWSPGTTEERAWEVLSGIQRKLIERDNCCLDILVAVQDDTDRMRSEMKAAGVEFLDAAS